LSAPRASEPQQAHTGLDDLQDSTDGQQVAFHGSVPERGLQSIQPGELVTCQPPVRNWIRDLRPEEAALFHSVALVVRDHECEIDLLVLWPRVVIAAIDVGQKSTRSIQAQWSSSRSTA
jgi:hypothetical protein